MLISAAFHDCVHLQTRAVTKHTRQYELLRNTSLSRLPLIVTVPADQVIMDTYWFEVTGTHVLY